MKKSFFFILLLLAFNLTAQLSLKKELSLSPTHPSLLIAPGDERSIKQSLASSPSLTIIHDVIIKESDSILTLPHLKYEKIGKRLLDISRESLRRIFYLSYSYRMTGDKKYARLYPLCKLYFTHGGAFRENFQLL